MKSFFFNSGLNARLVITCLTATTLAMPFTADAEGSGPAVKPVLVSAVADRWQSSMNAFAAADREQLPAGDGVLFVGSSTIRMWSSLAEDFRQLPVVINRGFGGSTMADCHFYARQLVNRYKPRQVLVYAGDNDLAEGRTPTQVLESFASFVSVVRSELPATRISYISIKPSPSRVALLPKIRSANLLLAAYVKTLANAEYSDIYTPMLAADGTPRMELFRPDQLHMNDAGYALWQRVINMQLASTAPVVPAATPPVAVRTPH